MIIIRIQRRKINENKMRKMVSGLEKCHKRYTCVGTAFILPMQFYIKSHKNNEQIFKFPQNSNCT